jgi:hypothetical protein
MLKEILFPSLLSKINIKINKLVDDFDGNYKLMRINQLALTY